MFSRWVPKLIFSALLGFANGMVWANASEEIEELIRNKQWTQAQQKLQLAIKQRAQAPNSAASPQWRLMSSQILAGQGEIAKAVEELQALIQEFPELPEPYNNLGVLLALQGHYAAAASALISAIQARPNYKIAHQNLGDLYTAMAQSAYAQAKNIKEGPGLLPLPAPSAATTTLTNTHTLR
jgi:tetratricopeptide (TPR) repeat protein